METYPWKKRAKFHLISAFIYWAARIWLGTVRVKILDPDIYEALFVRQEGEGNVVVGSWHRHAPFIVYFFRKLSNGAIMISRSKDGEITARVASRFGFTPVRGSSSKGGRTALEEMERYLNATTGGRRFCGTPVDGPRGPARKCKKGMLVLARETGSYFVPMACSGTKVVTLNSWDRMILPLPFSKMLVTFGEPFKIRRDSSEEELETYRLRAEQVLDAITDRADRVAGYTG